MWGISLLAQYETLVPFTAAGTMLTHHWKQLNGCTNVWTEDITILYLSAELTVALLLWNIVSLIIWKSVVTKIKIKEKLLSITVIYCESLHVWKNTEPKLLYIWPQIHKEVVERGERLEQVPEGGCGCVDNVGSLLKAVTWSKGRVQTVSFPLAPYFGEPVQFVHYFSIIHFLTASGWNTQKYLYPSITVWQLSWTCQQVQQALAHTFAR